MSPLVNLKKNSYYILHLDNGDRILGRFDELFDELVYFFEIIVGRDVGDYLSLSYYELTSLVKLKEIKLNKRFIVLFVNYDKLKDA